MRLTSIMVVWILAVSLVGGLSASTPLGRRITSAVVRFLLFYGGVFALIALTAAVGIGLVATDRIVMSPGRRVTAQAIHRAVSLAALAFLIIHILLEIAAERSHAVDAIVPFLAQGRTFYIGLGTIASDLILVIVASGFLRARFARSGRPWAWRAVHASAYLAWLLSILHGLLGGRTAKPYVDWSYGACVAAAAFALAIRMVAATRSREEVALAAGDEAAHRSPWPSLPPALAAAASPPHLMLGLPASRALPPGPSSLRREPGLTAVGLPGTGGLPGTAAGLPANAGFPDGPAPGFRDGPAPGFPVPGFPDGPASGFPDGPASGFPDGPAPGFPHSPGGTAAAGPLVTGQPPWSPGPDTGAAGPRPGRTHAWAGLDGAGLDGAGLDGAGGAGPVPAPGRHRSTPMPAWDAVVPGDDRTDPGIPAGSAWSGIREFDDRPRPGNSPGSVWVGLRQPDDIRPPRDPWGNLPQDDPWSGLQPGSLGGHPYPAGRGPHRGLEPDGAGLPDGPGGPDWACGPDGLPRRSPRIAHTYGGQL